MFDEQWQFAVEVERKYNQYRKKVMVRYDLSAAEVDVLLFLANNSQFDLAVDIVRVRKMQKSHVSLAVNKLCEKGYIQKETDAADRKKVHLKKKVHQKLSALDRIARERLENRCFPEFPEKTGKNFSDYAS